VSFFKRRGKGKVAHGWKFSLTLKRRVDDREALLILSEANTNAASKETTDNGVVYSSIRDHESVITP
jgi:hypothetical protein